MTTATVDTRKISRRFQDAGFSKKQSAGAAEILADLLAGRTKKKSATTALSKLESLEAGQAVLHSDNTDLRNGIDRLEAMMTKLPVVSEEVRKNF